MIHSKKSKLSGIDSVEFTKVKNEAVKLSALQLLRRKWMAKLHYLTSTFFLERCADLWSLVGGVSSVGV